MKRPLRYLKSMKIFNRGSSKQTGTDQPPAAAASDRSQAGILDLAAERIGAVVAAADRAHVDIDEAAASAAPSGSKAKESSSREQIQVELAAALAARSEQLKNDAHELEALLRRASGQLNATSSTPEPPPVAPSPPPAPTSRAQTFSPKATQAENPYRKTSRSTPPPSPPVSGAEAASEPVAPAEPEAAPAEPKGSGLDRRVTERFASGDLGEGHSPAPFKRRSGVPSRDRDAGYSADGVRLLATQMAVAGSSRQEIEARLSHEFGVDSPSELLDEVLRVRSVGTQRAVG